MNYVSKFILIISLIAFISACKTSGDKQAILLFDPAEGHYAVTQPNAPNSFVDIGSALEWRKDQCVLHQSAFDGGAKVEDFITGEKVEASEATYVSGTSTKTPGGHNIIAFKDRGAAEKFISQQGRGKILRLDELLDLK
ncbi:MAG: nitrous oxide reductase accessory protein NosL [Nitrospirota bacterium]|nr:MAG: nitrous oxide reductase accessory protein NosL [Nitrospirota bacterium]